MSDHRPLARTWIERPYPKLISRRRELTFNENSDTQPISSISHPRRESKQISRSTIVVSLMSVLYLISLFSLHSSLITVWTSHDFTQFKSFRRKSGQKSESLPPTSNGQISNSLHVPRLSSSLCLLIIRIVAMSPQIYSTLSKFSPRWYRESPQIPPLPKSQSFFSGPPSLSPPLKLV